MKARRTAYSTVSTQFEHFQPTSCGQWLGARNNARGRVDDAPPRGEGKELRHFGVDSGGVDGHCGADKEGRRHRSEKEECEEKGED